MTKFKTSALLLSCIVSLASCLLLAQVQRPGEYPRGEKPSPMMNFFVTSEPIGDGGNLGGLAGADAHCQMLATAVGAGNRTWHAYLSTQARPGQPAVKTPASVDMMPLTRREALRITCAGLTLRYASNMAQAQLAGVKARVFDTFGTVVDWRGSVIAGKAPSREKNTA